VLALNKVDLINEAGYQQEYGRLIRRHLRFVPWAPLVFISAKQRAGLDGLLRQALRVAEQRQQRAPTGPLNTLLQRVVAEHPPRSVQGRRLKLLYATQAAVRPPEFVLFVNDARLLHFSYRRYLENRIRAEYGFEGTAVRLVFKSRADATAVGDKLQEKRPARQQRRGVE
jgi:GTP-binding protein